MICRQVTSRVWLGHGTVKRHPVLRVMATSRFTDSEATRGAVGRHRRAGVAQLELTADGARIFPLPCVPGDGIAVWSRPETGTRTLAAVRGGEGAFRWTGRRTSRARRRCRLCLVILGQRSVLEDDGRSRPLFDDGETHPEEVSADARFGCQLVEAVPGSEIMSPGRRARIQVSVQRQTPAPAGSAPPPGGPLHCRGPSRGGADPSRACSHSVHNTLDPSPPRLPAEERWPCRR